MRTTATRPPSALFRVLILVLLFSTASVAQAQSVTSFVLVDAGADTDIRTLSEGDVIDLAQLSATSLSIRAETSPATTGSVRFDFNGTSNYQTENNPPYALNGDTSGDYDGVPELAQTGTYTLIATPYPQPDAGGAAGTPLTITFSVETNGDGSGGGGTDTGAFQEEGGLVVIEMESEAPGGNWEERTDFSGYTGDSYLIWEGSSNLNTPGSGLITYPIEITTTGTYKFEWRNAFGAGSTPTEHNDTWLKIDADAFYAERNGSILCPKGYDPAENDCSGGTPNGSGSDGWFKVYRSGGSQGAWSWSTRTSDNDAHEIYAQFDSPGTYTLRVSARSDFHAIDRMVLANDAFGGDPRDPSLPESPRDATAACNVASTGLSGDSNLWHPLTLTLEGPCTSEGATPNPFLDYRLTVEFSHAGSGTVVTVPGYFAADGDAANTGATSGAAWRAHFTPRQTGNWTYEVSFVEGGPGSNIAISTGGTPTGPDGQTGAFTVGPTDKSGRDHRGKGMLTYVGDRYLQFDDGSYFLKGGADSPENLLAYSDFDGTPDGRDYGPHLGDWSSGDPTWSSGRGKGLIGALNYLARDEGMNAFSFLTMNVNGDGDDVWPWTSPSATERFDVSKLDQWEIVMTHADVLGLFKHIKTQETENDQYLDGGDLGVERKLYYRELIARFAHHHALNWNLGEEYDVYNEKNDGDQSRLLGYIDYIRSLDAYDHPIVVHTYPNQRDNVYTDLLGEDGFTGPSIQLGGMNDGEAHDAVTRWLEESENAGRIWNVSVDEPGNANAGLRPDSDDNHDAAREVMWAVFFAGGDGLEWYFGYGYPDDDLDADDWRSRDRFWDFHRAALDFMWQIPFPSMSPDDERLGGESGYVFSDGQDRFAVYLKDGGTDATLDLPAGSFDLLWYDPRSGGDFQTGSLADVSGGSNTSLGAPPSDSNQDWVVVAKRTDVPLPVELSTFEATTDGPAVAVLQWTTATETDNAGFDILHRAPGTGAFATLGFVDGAGTTASPQSYRFRATGLSAGTHTFRLRQVDIDGASTLSDPTEVTLVPDQAVTISAPAPSPVRTQATMTLGVQTAQPVRVSLYDMLGRQVRILHDGPVSPAQPVTVTVQAGQLAPGIYFVRAVGAKATSTRRIAIVR
ncbi:DUF5060 domain-containing protein [Longibacter sp.]|jgi:hypothetical protein|uniref:DUF5060 domain-containing protein n=1 Tax=Longibacter sp. TaxID=2045415 RepID=UPI003EC10F96